MTRWGLRVIAAAHRGDTFECAQLDTRDDYEQFRQEMHAPDDFEVVQLDDITGQAL